MCPAISVIIPVYNAEKNILFCLNSIMNQTFYNFEVIIINDGSTDSSGDICDRYAKKDHRFKVYHKINGGVASARQFGIEIVSGEYTLHIDSDDWIEHNMFEELYHCAKENNSDIVYFDYFLINKKKNIRVIKQDFGENINECVKAMLQHKMAGMLWTKMIKTSLFVDNDINFPEGLNMWEDLYFSLRCFIKAKKISYLNKPYYYYVLNDGSMIDTMTFTKSKNKIEIAKKIFYLVDDVPYFKSELVITKVLAKIDFVGCKEIYNPREWKENFPIKNIEILNMRFAFKLKIIAFMANNGMAFMIYPIKRFLSLLK
ncbi:glycosyltransferase family 2 protein [Pectobacterium cacticida]|uniref:glycosyltransferase family 2 protein n=1 Tax=Pectobacterium cacticida TaxID=69221 RepID=UPI0039864F43